MIDITFQLKEIACKIENNNARFSVGGDNLDIKALANRVMHRAVANKIEEGQTVLITIKEIVE